MLSTAFRSFQLIHFQPPWSPSSKAHSPFLTMCKIMLPPLFKPSWLFNLATLRSSTANSWKIIPPRCSLTVCSTLCQLSSGTPQTSSSIAFPSTRTSTMILSSYPSPKLSSHTSRNRLSRLNWLFIRPLIHTQMSDLQDPALNGVVLLQLTMTCSRSAQFRKLLCRFRATRGLRSINVSLICDRVLKQS